MTITLPELAPDIGERMRPLWAAADEALRSDLSPLVELARLCNGEKAVLSTVEFERAERGLTMRRAADERRRTLAPVAE